MPCDVVMVTYDKAQSLSHHTKEKYINNAFSMYNNKLQETDLASVREYGLGRDTTCAFYSLFL